MRAFTESKPRGELLGVAEFAVRAEIRAEVRGKRKALRSV